MMKLCATAFALSALAAVASANDKVSVEVVRALSQAPYYVALGKGYFAQEGIDLEAGVVKSALDTVPSLVTGRLDVSLGAPTAGFFNAAARGFDLHAVAVMGMQGSPVIGTQPLVLKSLWDAGTIRSGKDLRGHKVAINVPGDITEFILTLILQKYGMEPRDVNVTPLGFAEQVVAFKNGAIDAGFLPEPLSTNSQEQGTAVLLKSDADVGAGTITTLVFFGDGFTRDHRDVALRFLKALIRAARECQGDFTKNPELAAAIAKGTGLPVEVVMKSTPYAFDPNLDIAKHQASLSTEEAIHRKNGRLNYQQPLAMEKLVDASLVHEAAASLK